MVRSTSKIKIGYLSSSLMSGAFQTWNLGPVCLVLSNQGGATSETTSSDGSKSHFFHKDHRCENMAGSQVEIWCTVEPHATTGRSPWGEDGVSCPSKEIMGRSPLIWENFSSTLKHKDAWVIYQFKDATSSLQRLYLYKNTCIHMKSSWFFVKVAQIFLLLEWLPIWVS